MTGCTSDDPAPATGPVEVSPPATAPESDPATDPACAALLAALPDEVDPGVRRRPVQPDSGRAAAWGDPPVTLECGVAPPDRAEPPFSINGVAFTTRDVGSATRWTTYGRLVTAAVTVPDAYSGAEIVLPLAEPIDTALPADPAAPPPLEEPTP